ncbi:DUF4214 domain-containing protein [Sphingomonas sp. UYEF23]|uniref:DUF4214 domain-containing protein n=1 Tax=Sphingomonas sp. UYEF23 TaxID=1756408 RepID=UPI003396F027
MLQREDLITSHRIPLEPAFVASIRSVADLLNWYDEVFLELAYQIMLRRSLDFEGRRYYLSKLRLGRSRLAILDQLSKASEAEPLVEQVIDLASELARYRASRRFFKGFKSRWTDLEIGNRGSFFRARAIANAVGQTRQDLLLICADLLATQRNLSRALSSQSMPVAAAAPVAPTAALPSVVRAPRVRTSFDVREIDFHNTEKRVINALRI